MEAKELADKIASTWEAMKAKMDENAAEMKAGRAADHETIARLSTAMDEQKKQLDATALRFERMGLVQPGDGKGIDPAKAAQKAAFFKWMRRGKGAPEPSERKALVEDTTGLYLVPEEIEAEIIRGLPQLNVMRGLASVRTIARDKLRKRTLTEVAMGWGKLETGTVITESTPTPATDYIYAEDLYGLAKVGEDELMDTDANLQAVLADSFAIARANAEEAAFVIGTGHTYNQPCGVAVDSTLRTSIGSGAGAAATGTYGITWATDDTVLLDDLLKAEYSLPAQYLRGAAWLMNRKTELAARVLKAATTGTFLWQPSLMAGQPNQFDGYPVHNSSSMNYPADTLAKTNVVFGNFQLGYRIVDRMGLAIQRLDELYAESGLVGFKAHFRVGGDIIRHAAFQLIANDV